MKLTTENCNSLSSLCGRMNVAPELLDEQLPVQDVLRQGQNNIRFFEIQKILNYTEK